MRRLFKQLHDLNCFYNKKRINLINEKFNLRLDGKLATGIEYHPRTDLTIAKINKDFDLVISRFVLEHVPPQTILKIHQNIADQIGKHYVLHYISPSDHRSYFDKSISLYDFLKYTEEEWNSLFTRYDYHNRMRLPEYIQLFESMGYKVIFKDFSTPKGKEKENFKSLKLNKRFANFTDEENTAGSIILFLEYNVIN